MPPRRTKMAPHEALDGLLDALADRVAERLLHEVPTAVEFETLRQEVRDLGRWIHADGGPSNDGRPGNRERRCKLESCESPHVAHGLCSRHYQAWRRRRLRERSAADKADH